MNYIKYTNYVPLPDWANWMAKEGFGGVWYFFEKKPTLNVARGQWDLVFNTNAAHAYVDPDGVEGWRDSLTKIVR